MKRILKSGGVGILNFTDLKNEFSLWQIYDSLEEFRRFAAVHCVPLHSMLYREGKGFYRARYLTKAFWLNVIGTGTAADVKKNTGEEFLRALLRKRYISAMSSKETENALNTEYSDGKIHEKIAHIAEQTGAEDIPEDKLRSILLLAICELSEKNVLDMQIERRGSREENAIGSFPAEEILSLTARDEPYKYFYHDSDSLDEGEIIRTSRIKAAPGVNRYKKVVIEIYYDGTDRLAEMISLKPEKYIWCNSAGGKIIKFLPSASIGGDLCMIRENLSEPDISIISAETKWSLDGDNSSFSAGSGAAGFLCVSGGRLNTAFYRRAKDHMVQLKLNTIIRRVVEVMVYEDRCEILTEDGNIITDKADLQTSERVVSLDKNSRLPPSEAAGIEDTGETTVSISQFCAETLREIGRDSRIFFGAPENRVAVKDGKVFIPNGESE